MDDRAESKESASVCVETEAVPKRRRLSREQRRRQLVEAAVRLIDSLGIHGTTVSKISGQVGLSEMAAYRHFGNKDEILMEASSYLHGRIFEWLDSSSNPCILDRFGELGQSHFDVLSSDLDMFTGAYIQFLTMTRGDGPLHDRIAENNRLLQEKITALAEQGIAEGSIRSDADAVLFTHEFIGWFLAEDVHCLTDLRDGTFSRSSHLRTLDLILRDAAAPAFTEDKGQAPG
jgi:AcrR family transcriptional regulator